MSAFPKPHPFTVDEYVRMAEAGILPEGDSYELLEGQVIEMTAAQSPHFGCVNYLTRVLTQQIGDRGTVHVQNPLLMGDFSLPEPDLAVLKPRQGDPDYRERMPTPDDALLVIEVSDSTLRHDRQKKMPIYARHGVSELWIVALNEQVVEVYRTPEAAGYADVQVARRGDTLAPVALPDLQLTVDGILG